MSFPYIINAYSTFFAWSSGPIRVRVLLEEPACSQHFNTPSGAVLRFSSSSFSAMSYLSDLLCSFSHFCTNWMSFSSCVLTLFWRCSDSHCELVALQHIQLPENIVYIISTNCILADLETQCLTTWCQCWPRLKSVLNQFSLSYLYDLQFFSFFRTKMYTQIGWMAFQLVRSKLFFWQRYAEPQCWVQLQHKTAGAIGLCYWHERVKGFWIFQAK